MITTEQLRRTAISLSILQLRNISKLVNIDMDTNSSISLDRAMVFWVANLLNELGLCDKDQLYLLLETYLETFACFANELHVKMEDKNLPTSFLMFADRVLVSLTNDKQLLNLKTGKISRITKTMPLEIISYNLTTLICSKLKIIEKLKTNEPAHIE